jgi:hypothetical protein
MGWIVPWLMDFDKCTINKSSATLKLRELCTQNPSFLNIRSPNFIDNDKIDTKCNKDSIIIYCTLVPNPHECIILCDIVMLCVKDEA